MDAADFDRIYDRFGDPVLNYCYYRLGTWEEAEDATQQIFLKAFAALPRFQLRTADSADRVRPWLFTIAHHEVANRHRLRDRHHDVSLDAAFAVRDFGPSPEELAVAADHQDRVRVLLANLSPDQRRVIELRLAGLSDGEIATVLDRTPGAVRATQFRAVSRLREMLGVAPRGNGGNDVW
jgi:RNA polymerase sigma-70 factor, ECF subfamily